MEKVYQGIETLILRTIGKDPFKVDFLRRLKIKGDALEDFLPMLDFIDITGGIKVYELNKMIQSL